MPIIKAELGKGKDVEEMLRIAESIPMVEIRVTYPAATDTTKFITWSKKNLPNITIYVDDEIIFSKNTSKEFAAPFEFDLNTLSDAKIRELLEKGLLQVKG